jgi:preprotein translocase subunit SecF
MEFFKIKRTIPFMRYALIFNIISLLTFIAAVVSLATKGLHLSIEFQGGTVISAPFKQAADIDGIRKAMAAKGFTDFTVQNYGAATDVLIRLPLPDTKTISQNEAMEKQKQSIIETLTPLGLNYDASKPTESKLSVSFVGSQVGKELAVDGLLAIAMVCIGIVIYLAIRFEKRFAVSAIIANLHDVVIILGVFSFFELEFSLPVLAGVLAVLGYSVNESVVVFDRAREYFFKLRNASTDEIFDQAITSTISRTIITHGTTEAMVITMLIFGGPTLQGFAIALTIGIVFGIYSSVLVACPLAKYLGVTREDFVKPEKKADEGQEGEIELP